MSLANGLLWGLRIDEGVVDESRRRSSSKLVGSMEWRCGINQAEKRCSLGMVLCNGIKSGVEGECRLTKQRIQLSLIDIGSGQL